MKKRYYLVDTENVGDRWVGLIDFAKETYVLVVFYTKNHSKLLEECFLKERYNEQIRWVECEAGNNALDQQLMGVLSYLISRHPDAEYVVFSNDNDYGNVIDFWKRRGRRIKRIGYAPYQKQNKSRFWDTMSLRQPFEDQTDISMDEGLTEFGTASNAGGLEPSEEGNLTAAMEPEGGLTENQIVVEAAKAIPMEDIGDWYTVLTALLGMEMGRECYICLRGDKESQRQLSQYLLPSTDERNLQLITLLYRVHRLDARKAQTVYQFVKLYGVKNKKEIKRSCDEQFGIYDGQTRYYKVLKPVLGVLKGI